MFNQKVIRVPILPWGLVNAHLIQAQKGVVLVDAGLPGTEQRLHRVLHAHGLGFSDIRLIIITHAHVDHAGNARRVQALSGAPIVAHAGDLPYYLREQPMSFCASGWFGRVFLKTGLMYQPYQGFTPDIVLRDGQSISLTDFGVDGVIQHTPGHTSGSLSVLLTDGQALVGDLVASGILLGGIVLTHRPKSPPFEDHPRLVGQVLQNILDTGGQQFYMGHGGPLSAQGVQRHAMRLAQGPHDPGF